MRNIINKVWLRMGWLYMPEWLFVWMYVKPAIEHWCDEGAHGYTYQEKS